jgi:hypothetical protein
MRTVTTIALLALGATLSLAQDPTGSWKGKLNIKFPPPPANATAQQKEGMEKMKAQIAKAVIVLKVNKDKTFSMKASNMPGSPDTEQKGNWSQSGAKITFKDSKQQKMPNGQTPPPQTGTLSKDGKTLTFQIPNGMGTLIFKKG